MRALIAALALVLLTVSKTAADTGSSVYLPSVLRDMPQRMQTVSPCIDLDGIQVAP